MAQGESNLKDLTISKNGLRTEVFQIYGNICGGSEVKMI